MTLEHPKGPHSRAEDLSIAPVFTLESRRLPRHELPADELGPDVAYQIVHDELMLDGNARLDLATFVATWMEPQAERLMAECFDKNMIDKDEYTFPANRTDLAALRVVVKRGFSHDMADLLVADLERQLPRLQARSRPVHDSTTASSFHH